MNTQNNVIQFPTKPCWVCKRQCDKPIVTATNSDTGRVAYLHAECVSGDRAVTREMVAHVEAP
jgi:hypothetical protein